MKPLILLVFSALISANLHAEETTELAVDSMPSESESYLEEIRAACEAEAAGLSDIEEYVRECIEAMKQNFTN